MRVGHRVVLAVTLIALALVPSATADVWLSVDEDGVNGEQIEIDAGEIGPLVERRRDAGHRRRRQDGLFDSGPIPPGGAFSDRMPVPGDHAYTDSSAGESRRRRPARPLRRACPGPRSPS